MPNSHLQATASPPSSLRAPSQVDRSHELTAAASHESSSSWVTL